MEINTNNRCFFCFSASVNLDQITRDLDFEALQSNLTNIAFCNVELELVSHIAYDLCVKQLVLGIIARVLIILGPEACGS